MQIIETVKEQIKDNKFSSSSEILAHALYSACHHGNFPGPNLQNISSSLDAKNKELVWGLINISQYDDYSNNDQSQAIQWIKDNFPEVTKTK